MLALRLHQFTAIISTTGGVVSRAGVAARVLISQPQRTAAYCPREASAASFEC